MEDSYGPSHTPVEDSRSMFTVGSFLNILWNDWMGDFRSTKQVPQQPQSYVTTSSDNTENDRIFSTDDHPQTEWRVVGHINGSFVEALADTGASFNAISEEQAIRMNLSPDPGSERKRFRLPSGEIRSSLGAAKVNFNFGDDTEHHSIWCNVVPILKEVVLAGIRRYSLRLLNGGDVVDEERARLAGYIAQERVLVVPDTGSTLMVISAGYARGLRLTVDKSRRSLVRLADGTEALTLGTTTAPWRFMLSTDQIAYEWHVLEGLNADAVLSLNFIKEHDVFEKYGSHFIDDEFDSELAEIYGICQVPRANERLGTLADDFDADMASANPFSYEMLVKEDARRFQIEEAIAELPRERQGPAHANEAERQEAWEWLKGTYVEGDRVDKGLTVARRLVQQPAQEQPRTHLARNGSLGCVAIKQTHRQVRCNSNEDRVQ
ncbi:hypothetical protein BJ170DRAFT_726912 [Xylariales sp. AK1849]|nr:hypothetical protein BJ170DRAFT_726912 [Xylariales sp. AK1849]